MARLQAPGARPADHRHGQHRQVLRAAAAGALPRGAPGRGGAAARGRQPRAAGGADAGRRGRPVGDGPRRRRRSPRAPKPSPRTRWCSSRRRGHPLLRGGPHAGRARWRPTRSSCASTARARARRWSSSSPSTASSQRIAMEMSSNETIKQAVMAGMGLSFLSLHTIGLELRSGLLQVLDVEGTPVMRMWNIVHLQLEAAVAGGRGLPLLHARAGRGPPAGARHAAAAPACGQVMSRHCMTVTGGGLPSISIAGRSAPPASRRASPARRRCRARAPARSISSNTPSAVLRSRLPVGSSASTQAGCVTSARAMATRWRSPPDSCAGWCAHALGQAHLRQHLRAPARAPAPAAARRMRSGMRHVVQRAELGQQVVELVDEAQVPVAPGALLGGVQRREVAAHQLDACRWSAHPARPAGAAACSCPSPRRRRWPASRPRRTSRSTPCSTCHVAAAPSVKRLCRPLRLQHDSRHALASLIAQRLGRVDAAGAPARVQRGDEGQQQRDQRDGHDVAALRLAGHAADEVDAAGQEARAQQRARCAGTMTSMLSATQQARAARPPACR